MNPDAALLNIFALEQPEHVERIRALADDLAAGAREPGAFDEALRRAHTLKGAARAVGLHSTELLAHALEALLLRARDGRIPFDRRAAEAAHRALDAAEDVLAASLSGRDEGDISGALRALEEASADPGVPAPAAGAAAEPRPAAPAAAANRAPSELVRVGANSVDALIRAASELVSASSAEGLAGQLAEDRFIRLEAAFREWQRLRRAAAHYAREKDDDPAFAPVAESLSFADREFRAAVNEARTALAAQRNRARELRERSESLYVDACRIRTTPAETVFGGMGAMVRDLARAQGKDVEFRADGMSVEADRLAFQALRDPVMHLLRNAVSHGVETPSEREAGRKPRAGRVRLSVETRKDRLLVAVEDDGRGLDPARIAQAAIARGLLTPAEAASRSAADLADILFQPGFSTAEAVTNVSGRGLGLSVVRETVARLQGEVAILNRVHGGIRVSLSVPISISTQHVLLVESSGQVFALPASFVERLWRGDVENIERVEGRQAIVLDSRPVFVANLSSVLGITYAGITPRPAGGDHAEGRVNVAVIASAARRAGFMVDRFLDYREAVIKDLGVPPSMSGFTAGGIPLEDGRVAVVIAPGALLDRFLDTGWQAAAIQTPEEAPPRKQPRILVVDDSITTRSLEKSILEAHGYQVRVAVDGVQALEQLRAEPADLVITDIMMPRMDGLELLRQIKGDRDIAHVPVIVVSSMEKREEQERGLSLGADAYIVKRKFDQRELLETVRQIL